MELVDSLICIGVVLVFATPVVLLLLYGCLCVSSRESRKEEETERQEHPKID